ncbi:uncharacterized protein LOC133317477 [Gastrolobium bilobum]|uniref:uncharacterized protein LOC133309620 n=1 Tax=Gastrolobium bilobum TaxID=150636 RepID=UPI002AB2ADD2|nr:uncharacterized protein LOC133309620 [Gastrolobium bilobum]XP_061375328.1 uncharacterized protein LOC133317477 [Gastrolobium bilobum]
MDPSVKLLPNQGEPLSDHKRYRRLVEKLNYLTVTRPDISFAISVVSQFLNSPCQEHRNAVIPILRYIKAFLGKCLNMKIKVMLKLLDTLMLIGPVVLLIGDLLVDIVSSLEATWFPGKVLAGEIITSFVPSNDQLADIFTKALRGPRIEFICNKLGTYDLYAPA